SRAADGAPPVLLLTSSASPGDQERCNALGIAARLLKPVKQSLLLDNVMRLLAGAGRPDRAPAGGAKATGPAAALRVLRVLLAEDNPVNQKFAVRVLEREGHQVAIAPDGRRAVELWSSQ